MLNKKYILFVFLFAICLISAVSAADIDNADELANMDDVGEVVIDEELSAAQDSELLSTDYFVDEKTFNAIQTNVDAASDGDRIILEGTYEGSGSPITVNKDLTIHGTGTTTLNAKGSSGIIVVENGAHVVLENIIFTNGKATNGGAIYKADATNCTFKQCTATENGGAMYNGTAINCTFTSCFAENGGGAYDSTVYNSTFSYCEANHGGAMYKGEAYNTRFEWCNKRSATTDGGVYCAPNCIEYEYEDDYDDTYDEYGVTKIDYEKHITVYYHAGSYCKVTASYSPSEFYEYTPYEFRIKGKKIASGKTNRDGVAKFKITLKPGKYKVEVRFPQISARSSFYITVKHVVALKSVNVKKSAKKLKLTATLKQGKKVLKKKKVTFRFNGKKYYAKTNKKGVAKVTIPKYELKKLKVGKKVTYKATYLKDTVKNTVKVKK